MIDKSKRVYVYFNLHKKCWSVRQSGRIVNHTDNVMLKDCRYLVGQAGRKKVLEEKRKNVLVKSHTIRINIKPSYTRKTRANLSIIQIMRI